MALAQARLPGGPDLSALPEGCIATVVSFTSPADACRLASVSPVFKVACDSDVVWAAFLPPGCCSMVSRRAPSLKKLYFSLCDEPVLIDDGKMAQWEEMYHAISKGPVYNMGRYADLLVLDLHAQLQKLLNSSKYVGSKSEARLVLACCRLEPFMQRTWYSNPPRHLMDLEKSVEVGAGFAGDEAGKRERSVYLSRENILSERQSRPFFRHTGLYILPMHFEFVDDDHDGGSLMPAPDEGNVDRHPKERPDGWSEIELGEFLTKDGEDREVEMSVLETKRGNWKSGLIVEGIEIRPKGGIGH